MTTAQRPEPAKILIVDDQPAFRNFVSRVLTSAGYTIATASDGPEALEIFERSETFNLVVTDLMMPGMRGDELARRVRRADPATKVLYVTAHRDELFRNTAALGDHEAFLDKPFRMQDLVEAVSTLLAGQQDPGASERIESGIAKQPTWQSLRVLIVEDVEADALLIQAELDLTRYEARCERVDTRAALINALDQQTWDLIITDHTMPQLNAITVLKIVRDRGLNVPCVLVSGTASKETAAAAMKIGADDFVSKENLRALGPSIARVLDDVNTRRARSSLSRLRLQNGQEFDVSEWAPDSAILTGLVGLAPGQNHACLLLAGGNARRVRIQVVRSEVATLEAGKIVYQTVVMVIEG